MARSFTPVVKQSRREGVALHPKAVKGLARRNYGPGDHGQARRSKPSDYGLQLREKQKVKRMYGLLEKQFRRFVAQAMRMDGVAGENLLFLLERRLDNVVYRAGFATSRQAARQLVSHNHIRVNGTKLNIPSAIVKPGDVVSVKDASKKNAYFTALAESLAGTNDNNTSWIATDAKKLEAKVTGMPLRDELDSEIAEQLIIEYYSR